MSAILTLRLLGYLTTQATQPQPDHTAKIKAGKADRALIKRNEAEAEAEKFKVPAFAQSIAKTCDGLRALTEACVQHRLPFVNYVPGNTLRYWPGPREEVRALAYLNNAHKDLPQLPKTSVLSIFAPTNPQLRLQGVAVQSYWDDRVRVALVIGGHPGQPAGAGALQHSVITIDPTGEAQAFEYRTVLSPEGVVGYAFGTTAPNVVFTMTTIDDPVSLEEALGEGRGHAYLAQHIGSLGTYMEAIAATLQPPASPSQG